MNVLRSSKEPEPSAFYRSEQAPLCHECPVCGTVHEVSVVRGQFAYGRQLSCSPDCEAERRRRSRAAYRRTPTLVRSNAVAKPFSIPRGPAPAAEKPTSLKLMISESAFSGVSMKAGTDAESNRAMADGIGKVGESANSRTRLTVPAGEHKAVVSAIVESADVLQVRRAIFQTGGESVGILKTAPVPRSTKVRVFIGMKLDALDAIMTAIMRSVTACEFGRVVRM